MAHESLIAGQWLQGKLRTDPTLFPPDPDVPDLLTGVYRRAAPQGATLPFCVWQWQGGADENAAGGPAYSVPVAFVRVVSDDRLDATSVEAALNRIDVILSGARDFIHYDDGSGFLRWYSIAVQRANIQDYPETGEATYAYEHQGRLWAITVIACNDPGLAG